MSIYPLYWTGVNWRDLFCRSFHFWEKKIFISSFSPCINILDTTTTTADTTFNQPIRLAVFTWQQCFIWRIIIFLLLKILVVWRAKLEGNDWSIEYFEKNQLALIGNAGKLSLERPTVQSTEIWCQSKHWTVTGWITETILMQSQLSDVYALVAHPTSCHLRLDFGAGCYKMLTLGKDTPASFR